MTDPGRLSSVLPPNCITVDVEEWFHLIGIPALADPNGWDGLESRLEEMLPLILDLLATYRIKATFFVLGWVARSYPRLVHKIDRAGHEIACHGDLHVPVDRQNRAAFRADITCAKACLEDIVGRTIQGYRAPGFSIRADRLWVFSEINEAGFNYDASVFPGRHPHGGLPGWPDTPHLIYTDSGPLIEFPASLAARWPVGWSVFGGGYLRMTPRWLLLLLADRRARAGWPTTYYIHPRDFDPNQPRLAMRALRRLRSYSGVGSSLSKISAILTRYRFQTMGVLASELTPMVPTIDLRNQLSHCETAKDRAESQNRV